MRTSHHLWAAEYPLRASYSSPPSWPRPIAVRQSPAVITPSYTNSTVMVWTDTPPPTPSTSTISCWLSLFVRSLRRNGLNWSAPFLCSPIAMVATLLRTGCCVRWCRSAMWQRPSAKGRETPAEYTGGATASCLVSRSGGLIHTLWPLRSWSYTGKPDLSTSWCFTSHAVKWHMRRKSTLRKQPIATS